MYPFNIQQRDEIVKVIIDAFGDDRIKNEIAKRVRVEMDNQRAKTNTATKEYHQSYESLTSGNVNLQLRMMSSGYDMYGRTILGGLKEANNNNIYQKMKNRIRYGKAAQNGYDNNGKRKIF